MTPPVHLVVSLTGTGSHLASAHFSCLGPFPRGSAMRDMARTAERGRFDAVLLGLPGDAMRLPRLDPLPLLGALIGATERIGLGAAWTVDFTEPYNVARVFATLDHLSYGRTAWIIGLSEGDTVDPRIGRPCQTSDAAGYYRRAGEFIDVVRKLWDSWEDEGFALDKASGMFADPDRVHPIEHAGDFFTVRGPLNVPRPPQGNLALVMSDPGTEPGRRFAAANADVILIDEPDLAAACSRYREFRELTVGAGRDGGALRILADVLVVLGDSETEAQRRAAELDAAAPATSSALCFAGTPEQLVDMIGIWRRENACDGFNLLPAVLPDDLDVFVDAVIPLLQQRGLYRRDYAGTTLREHLGLARPLSQYSERKTA